MLLVPQTAQARINEPEVENHQFIARMQENFRAIVQGSDDAIIGKTIDGLVTSWNPGATRIFGYTADESGARLNAASCNTTHARFVVCGNPPCASST